MFIAVNGNGYETDNRDEKIIGGMRAGNRSIKALKINEHEFLVVEKFYFLGIPAKKRTFRLKSFEEAEDMLLSFKFYTLQKAKFK